MKAASVRSLEVIEAMEPNGNYVVDAENPSQYPPTLIISKKNQIMIYISSKPYKQAIPPVCVSVRLSQILHVISSPCTVQYMESSGNGAVTW